jgi:DNA (cytosine-5)-methyltransferase 1
MKILNLYAGIGGNRKLWGDEHDITAIEYDPETAEVYKQYFPNDNVIVTDAHQYLLDNHQDFDFIWSSPPCPTHSDIRRCGVQAGQYEAMYPDMDLYQEIILLQHFGDEKTKWVIENVIPYYEPLVKPTKVLHRHNFWANFIIGNFNVNDERRHNQISGNETFYDFNVVGTNIKDKRKALRNMVNPDLGLHILECAQDKIITLEAFV